MMSCKKNSRLLSKQLDCKLSRYEVLSVRVHLMMCGACANFAGNLQLLRAACRRTADRAEK